MNDGIRVFLDSMLIANPVVMTFLGVLTVVLIPRTLRSALRPALRFSVILFFTGLFGATLVSLLPNQVAPIIYLSIGLTGLGLLLALGELKDEWNGMPQAVLAIVPLIGFQILVSNFSEPSARLAAAGGNALGFAIMFLLIAAIRESTQISETNDIFKTTPVVIFSMAMFAIAFSGFLFW